MKSKNFLSTLGYPLASENEREEFTFEITPEFCKAVFESQSESGMEDADGILDPKTIR